jgi:hypothetical protein
MSPSLRWPNTALGGSGGGSVGSEVPLWVVLLVGLASPLASFGTAWITIVLSNKRELQRLAYEKELQQQTQEREDRLRLHDERVTLYRNFLVEARRLKRSTTVDLGSLQELEEEINFISSNEVYRAAGAVLPALLNFQQVEKEGPNVDSSELSTRLLELEYAMYDFRNIARDYLGSVPETPSNLVASVKNDTAAIESLGDTPANASGLPEEKPDRRDDGSPERSV